MSLNDQPNVYIDTNLLQQIQNEFSVSANTAWINQHSINNDNVQHESKEDVTHPESNCNFCKNAAGFFTVN